MVNPSMDMRRMRLKEAVDERIGVSSLFMRFCRGASLMQAIIVCGCRLRPLPPWLLRSPLLVGLAVQLACAPAPSSAQSPREASPLEKKVAAVLPSKEEDRWLE